MFFVERIPGEYALPDSGIKAEMGGSTLTAWHVEGVSYTGAQVTARLLQAPTGVCAIDRGEDY